MPIWAVRLIALLIFLSRVGLRRVRVAGRPRGPPADLLLLWST